MVLRARAPRRARIEIIPMIDVVFFLHGQVAAQASQLILGGRLHRHSRRGIAVPKAGGEHARHRGARPLRRPRRLVPVPAPRKREHAIGLRDGAQLEPSADSLDDHGERHDGAQARR